MAQRAQPQSQSQTQAGPDDWEIESGPVNLGTSGTDDWETEQGQPSQHPTTPEGVNALLGTSVGAPSNRPLTPAEQELMHARDYSPKPAYHQPVDPRLAPVLPGANKKGTPAMTPEQRKRAIELGLLDAAPMAAATATSFIPGVGPLLSVPVGMAGEAIRRTGRHMMDSGIPSDLPTHWGEDVPDNPESLGTAATDVIKTGTESAIPVVATELGIPAIGGLIANKFGIPATAAAIRRMTLPADARALEDIFNAGRWGSAAYEGKDSLFAISDDIRALAKAERSSGSGVFDRSAAGGMFNSEYRQRRFIDHIEQYQDDLYKQLREPSISQSSARGGVVSLQGNTANLAHAADALLTSLPPGDTMRPMLQRIVQDPHLPIPIAEADQIAQHLNKQRSLLKLADSISPSVDLANNARVASFNQLDEALSNGINSRLQAQGMGSLKPYEQRYAILEDLKNSLKKTAPTTEAGRLKPGEVATVGTSGLSMRTRVATGIGQNPGRKLMKALDTLADSDFVGQGGAVPGSRLHGPAVPHANLPAPTPTPPAGGALPQAPTPLGPVPPTPPGPPAVGTHFTGGTPHPSSAWAAPTAGNVPTSGVPGAGTMTPANIGMTGLQQPLVPFPGPLGEDVAVAPPAPYVPPPVRMPWEVPPPAGGVQEPLGQTPSVPAPLQNVPPESATPTGPAPQPTAQPSLGAPSFPAGPKSASSYTGPERRGGQYARDVFQQGVDAAARAHMIRSELTHFTGDTALSRARRAELESELERLAQVTKDADEVSSSIPQTGLTGAKAPPPATAVHAMDTLGIPRDAYERSADGQIIEFDIGLRKPPSWEGGPKLPVTFSFKNGEAITPTSLQAKIDQALRENPDILPTRAKPWDHKAGRQTR